MKIVTFTSRVTVVLYPITNTEMNRSYLATAFIGNIKEDCTVMGISINEAMKLGMHRAALF